jgi:glyoxylase-like metal-dependent hydrolase (beta-lactamase superfamily II)
VSARGYAVTEIGERTWRIATMIGERDLFQYVLAGDDARAVLIDTGTARTPHEAILPALGDLGIATDAVSVVVVTHPDLDHQGGLAALRDALASARMACGFADMALVSAPDQLVADRYDAYDHAHGMRYGDADQRWMRSLYGGPVWIDLPLSGGEELALGHRTLRFLHAPGHSAGHLMVHDAVSGELFTSDAVQGAFIPAADGSAALPPTYEEIDPYLATIDLVERLEPAVVHSGHWPTREGAAIPAWLDESREYVAALDSALHERLVAPATLRELCDHADARLGPYASGPIPLMFAVHGHLRGMVRRGRVAVDLLAAPPRFHLTPEKETPDAQLV